MRRWQDYGARNGECLAQLLHAFFDYWAWRHDYGGAVVCVRSGSIVTKRRKGWTTRVGTERHLICVEDPFETSHDLGRVVDKRSIFVLRDEFERAERILRTEPNPLELLFQEYVTPASQQDGRGQGGDEDEADEDGEVEQRE
jgi:DNA polymerase sigma